MKKVMLSVKKWVHGKAGGFRNCEVSQICDYSHAEILAAPQAEAMADDTFASFDSIFAFKHPQNIHCDAQ
jgi:hypothetical protein